MCGGTEGDENKTGFHSNKIAFYNFKYKYFVCFFFFTDSSRGAALVNAFTVYTYIILLLFVQETARVTHTHTRRRILLLPWCIICLYACTNVLLCRCLVRVCVCLRCVIGQCPSNIVVVVVVVLRSSILLL